MIQTSQIYLEAIKDWQYPMEHLQVTSFRQVSTDDHPENTPRRPAQRRW